MALHMKKFNATGNAAVSLSALVEAGGAYLQQVTIHFGVAPAAAGSLVITLDANAGPTYDAVLVTQALAALTDYAYQPACPYILEAGDKIVVTYANADSRVYGLQVTFNMES